MRDATVAELTSFLVTELTESADGTDIRPGILESGVGRAVIKGVDRRCDHVLRDFVPKMRRAGFANGAIHMILVANPGRCLPWRVETMLCAT